MINLTPLEAGLVDACREGAPFVCDPGVPEVLRAEVVSTLCLGLRSDWPAPRGVRIRGASIIGQLDFEEREIPAQLILDGCVADDGINLCFSRVFLVDLTRCRLGPVMASRIFVRHNLILFAANIRDKLDLRQAVIEGQVFADQLTVSAQIGQVAIRGAGIRVQGDIFFRECTIQGEVQLPGADVHGNVEFDGARLNNPGHFALNLEGINVNGRVFLRSSPERRFHCSGEVRLLGARISDELNCAGALMENIGVGDPPSTRVLTCDRLQIEGSVFLNTGFYSRGEVRLAGARIGSNLELNGAALENSSGFALFALDAQVKGMLRLTGLARTPVGRVSLDHGGTHIFADDEASWPAPDMLEINGFTYDELGQTSPTGARKRLEWLRLQPKPPFRSQPYEQLAKVLRGMGHLTDAKSILVAKQDDLRAYGELRGWERFANWFWGATIGHGYMARRVWPWILNSIIAGWLIYGLAYWDGVLALNSRGTEHLAPINLLILATDKFVPMVNLGSSSGWRIDTTRVGGSILQLFEIAYRALGWFFTGLAAAALAGLLRKE